MLKRSTTQSAAMAVCVLALSTGARPYERPLAHSYALKQPLVALLAGNGKDFADWVKSPEGPEFGGGFNQERACTEADCTGSAAKKVIVTLVAAVEALKANITDPGQLPTNGVVVAYAQRASASDELTERRYKIPKNRDRVYFVITPTGVANVAAWTSVTVNGPGTIATYLGHGTFKHCNPTHDNDVSTGSFGGCPRSGVTHKQVMDALNAIKTTTGTLSVNAKTAYKNLMTRDPFEGPIWLSCVLGCCSVDDP